MGRPLEWPLLLPPSPPHVDTGARRRRTDMPEAAPEFDELDPQQRIDCIVRLIRYLERHADEYVAHVGHEVQLDLRSAMAMAEAAQSRRPH